MATVAVIGLAFPTFAEKLPVDENLSFKIIIQQKDLESYDHYIEENLQEFVDNDSDRYQLSQRRGRVFEIYYDLPELIFLKNNGMVFYQAEEYLSKKKKKKKYHEKILYNPGSTESSIFKVKHYTKIQTQEGKHPLFSLVKRRQRAEFFKRLHQDGVKFPLRLKAIFQVSWNTHDFTVFSREKKLLLIRNSVLKGIRSKSEITFGLVRVDINKELFAELEEPQKNSIRDLLIRLKKIGKPLSHDEVDYKIIFQQMEKKIMFFHLQLRYPSIANFLYACVIGLVGGILIIFLFWERKSQ